MSKPFMEHPSGEFRTAVEAIAYAVKRLRESQEWDRPITFCAQGMGERVDSYHMAEITLRRDQFTSDIDLNPDFVVSAAGVRVTALTRSGTTFSLAHASPLEAARVMNVIFRNYLGIRPHTDEGDDYAIGAEF